MNIFAYASLAVAREELRPANLAGYRRMWNVAMDNRVDLPGYKYYVDPKTGIRPSVYVAFLNLVADPECESNGAVLPASERDLEVLDRRERNYERAEVSLTTARSVAPAQTYVGTAVAKQRFSDGLDAGEVVVARAYYESVRAAFRRLGSGQLERFEASTDQPPCPVVDLLRVDA